MLEGLTDRLRIDVDTLTALPAEPCAAVAGSCSAQPSPSSLTSPPSSPRNAPSQAAAAPQRSQSPPRELSPAARSQRREVTFAPERIFDPAVSDVATVHLQRQIDSLRETVQVCVCPTKGCSRAQ